MRKLYALLAGLLLSLTAIHALPATPDVANFTFVVDHPNNHVAFTNTSVLGNEPGNRLAYWTFGDGTSAVTGALQNTDHQYPGPGTYNVCLKIYRFRPNLGDSVVSAQVCKTVVIETACQANFERLIANPTTNPLYAIFRAIPTHNANKKPVRICWTFGDGHDTCIQYSNTAVNQYLVNHLYASPGNYEVCVNILYDGGCQANKCGPINIERPDSCHTNVVRLPGTAANPLTAIFQALPWHNNNKKPQRICWTFGDGHDTCIIYLNIFNGQYTVPHTYLHPGNYEVCASILYYGGCESRKCEHFQVGPPDSCGANFERVPTSPTTSPLLAYFHALPQHNNNRKPDRICWTFGDGHDTCVNYTESYTGVYGISHQYGAPGNYQVCVNIRYYGGCEARKCEGVTIGRPDTCHADFERIPVAANTSPLLTYFRALPQHNNNRKPSRVCWTFGDGRDTCIPYAENYTGQYVVSHRYNQPGNYQVCVDILYYGGCEARKCNPVQVGEPDSCSANFESPATSPTPLGKYFIAQPWHNHNKKPVRICWTFGDGRDTCINYPTTFTGQYGVYHLYNQPGTYNVCVHIRYDGGCESDKCKPVVVGVPDSCSANFESPTTSPTSLNKYFIAQPWHNHNKKPVRICWTFGDGRDTCINYATTYTGVYAVMHHYPQPGTYNVCVHIRYDGGCESDKCKPVVVGEPADSCSANFESPAATPTSLGKYFIAQPWHNHNKKPVRICWTFGDGRDTCINYPTTYTGQYGVFHQYAQPGTYNVCVHIRYDGGCESDKCKPVVVPSPTTNCVVHILEITPSITSLVRGFLAVPSSNPPARPVRVCWNFGDGSDTCIIIDPSQPLPDLTIRHTYPAPGVYRVCVRVLFQGGCVAEECKEVVIHALSDICGGFFTDSLVGPRSFLFRGHSIHAPNDDVIDYRWTFGDGVTSFGQNVTHVFTQAGDYNVCLLIRTRLGCETRICKTVRVPGNNQPALVLSPNPAANVLQVAFFSTHTETVTVRLLNNNGTPIRVITRNVTVGPNNWSMDVSTLIPGIYSLVVQSPNQLASAIFIKQ